MFYTTQNQSLSLVLSISDTQITESYSGVFIADVYFVSLYWDTSINHSRKKRSCFGHGRQKRSCVEPKDAPSPQNLTIIPVYDAKTDINYTLSTQHFNCLYWNGMRWTSDGCKVIHHNREH